MKYRALLSSVADRGKPPVPFLDALVAWGKQAPDDIFAVNSALFDVMPLLAKLLGPWQGKPGSKAWLQQRKCALLELLRVLAGFESSWDWNEGVDITNAHSMAHIEGQETGIFQVSYDSIADEHGSRTLHDLLVRHGVFTINDFISRMKTDHPLALEYAARLLRQNYHWDGPIMRGEVNRWLSREAMNELAGLV